ncbi:MAG: hypothetical protein K2K15_01140, partial [Anaeroplasmataceae bacterium]|nr:hypothetical protein [Anaeroplasmataceae bacterium]
MKKLYVFLSLLLGIFLLASCDQSQTVKYVDSDGNEKEFQITVTDDKATVEAVLDFMDSADYSTMNQFGVDVSASITASALDAGQKTNLKVELSSKLGIHSQEGIYFEATGKSDSDSKVEEMGLKCYFNAPLDSQLMNSNEYIYCEASMADESVKYKFTIEDAIHGISLILDEITSDLPIESIPTDSIPNIDLDDVDAFYEVFPTSKIRIASFDSKSIVLSIDISYGDILTLAGVDVEVISQALNLDLTKTISLQYEVDAKSGFMKGIHFEFNDVEVLNLILMMVGSNALPMDATLQSFVVNLDISFQYENVKITKLTEAQKAEFI